jgi:hypothetical protein
VSLLTPTGNPRHPARLVFSLYFFLVTGISRLIGPDLAFFFIRLPRFYFAFHPCASVVIATLLLVKDY